ncbi:carboxypeptidase-like regulatory domain-containing protein [Streptomyces sp. NPDC053493]|uniref:carboxypeptidase-like regulatory domain-containing protein n=1 Tax=Streptomyces sp. NPDC053493 TaxID=3365705 RepID=UPI0037D441CD
MRSDLRRLSAVSLVTALTLGAAVGPAFAEDAPAPSPLGIGRALTIDAQRGTFRVTAWTDAPQATVTSVSAKVRQGDTVLAEIPALTENASSRGTFALPEEATLKLTEDGGTIPSLGKYAIDVTATDSLGNTVTRTDAGTLDFTLKPRLNEFAIGDPSWTDRNLHPKGALVGVQPGSGDEVPLSGRTVSYERTGEDTPFGSAVTGETGAFTGEPVPVATRYTSAEATFTENSTEVHGTATYYAYTSGSEKWSTVTATADKARAEHGETVTISGRVTDPSANGAPLADVPLSARLGGGLSKTVRTDAEGRFSVQLVAAPGRDSYGTWSGWHVQSTDPFVTFYTSGPLALPADSRTSVIGYKLGTDARLTVYGDLRSPYESWTSTSSSQTVVLEQSPDGQTGWKQAGSTSFYNGNDGRTAFTLGVWNKGGWFRLRHVANDYFGQSVSKPFYVVRTDTRVQSLKASPDPVAKGAAVTVTASLQHYGSGAWRGLAYQPVSVWFKPWGANGTWKQVATGRSSGTGAVSVKTTATADGWYQVRYYGDSTHFQTFSGQDWVDVR